MNYIDKDIVDHEDYIEFTTFNKFNIKIFFTKKHYGSIPSVFGKWCTLVSSPTKTTLSLCV